MSKTIRREPKDPDTIRHPRLKRLPAIFAVTLTLILSLNSVSTLSAESDRPKQVSGGDHTTERFVVNVNTATEAQLAYLPGVGPVLATAIYTYAEAGPRLYNPTSPENSACDHKCHMQTLADLDKVKGIGPAKLAAITPYVVFIGETTAAAKIKVAKPSKAEGAK